MMLAARNICWIAPYRSTVKPVLGSEAMATQLVIRAPKAELTMRGKLNCGEQPCVVTKACLRKILRAGYDADFPSA